MYYVTAHYDVNYSLLYSLFSPAISEALSREQKLSDRIHQKWAFQVKTSTAKSFTPAFPENTCT